MWDTVKCTSTCTQGGRIDNIKKNPNPKQTKNPTTFDGKY